MRFAGVACGTVFLGLALPAWTQDITSQIVVTGRSLAVEPATNNFAAPGGVTTFLTTYDGGNGQPLFPFSGEAKPMFLGSSNYVTDYEGHLGILDPTGSLVNYGEMVISNMPVGIDSDGDGLPDFLEKNLSSTFTVDATDREDWRFDGNTNNSEWTLSFSRSANAYQGSYTLRKKTDPNNPDKIWNGNFQLKGGTGTVTFATNTRTFSFSTASFDTIYPESNSGAGTYGVTTSGQILASGFWMNSSFGPAHRVYINPFLIQRIGTSERGRAVLYAADGHPPANASSTAYPDYTEFHLEVTNLPASLTQTPNSSSTLPWNDDFSSTNSSANYLDFRYSHFARFEIADGRLNLVADANPYGETYGNLSIYSPPHLLLPLNSSWDISFQVSLPAPTADLYYRGVGVSLLPENETYDIANFGATLYSFELGQDNRPQAETFLATYARKDWVENPSLGLETSVNFTSAFLRFSYNSTTKVLSTYYDSNVSSPTRTWTSYDELNLDPADPTSAAADIGLTSNSQIRLELWADAWVTNSVTSGKIWVDSLSVTQKQPQTISFGPLPAKAVGDVPFNLTATASSGLPVVFSSSDPSVAEINGSTVTVKSPGLVTIAASQSGNETYAEVAVIQKLMVVGSPLSLPVSEDFSSLTPNRYYFHGDPSTGHQLQVTNGTLRFSANQGGTYDTAAATGPNLSLPLNSNWTVSVDATMPGDAWSPQYVGIYMTLLKNDGSFSDYFTQGTNRIKATSLKLLREGASTSTYVNAHNYDPATAWDFEGPTNALGSVSRTVTLRWTHSAAEKKLQAWYDPDTTNNAAQGWVLLHEFSTDPGIANSLGQKWSLNLSSDSLILSLSGTSLDSTVGQEIYFDNLAASAVGLPTPPPDLSNGLRANLGQAFSYTPDWDNSPISFTATNLPTGLTNNTATGAITGTPTQAGYYRVIQTASNEAGSADFLIPMTILGAPQALPFFDEFSGTVPNRYMPYEASRLLENPGYYPQHPGVSLAATNGVLKVICPTDAPGHHSIGWVPNLKMPLSSTWEVCVDIKLPNDFSTTEAELGLSFLPEIDASDTLEIVITENNELSFDFNRDTQWPGGMESGSGLQRSAYVNDVSQEFARAWYPFDAYSFASLRVLYRADQKTISTWGRTHPGEPWTKVGEDLDFNPNTPGTLAHGWGLSTNSSLSLALSGYFELVTAQTLPEIYADNLSATLIQPPVSPPALTNGLRANLGQVFSYSPVFSGSPATFSLSPPIPGLTLNPATGQITGTPEAAGYYRSILTASNAAGTATLTIPLTIPGAPQTLPFSDNFTNTVANRYMPLNLEAPATLEVTDGVLRYLCLASDSDGALAAWIPNLPLPMTNSWDVVVDVGMPAGWSTPYAGVGLTLMIHEEAGTIETTGRKNRLNLKLSRDTEDSVYGGNYFARAAYANDIEYAPLPWLTTNTPATRATLRLSFHAPSKSLSTWYRTNGSSSWESLGTPYLLDPSSAGSLGEAWGLSNSSTLRIALWGDSYTTNGTAGQAIELDNLSASLSSGLIYPSLPLTLTRRPGQPIFFSASPRDVGTYTYEWEKGSVLLPDEPSPLPPLPGFTEQLSTYYISNPSEIDAGLYRLIIHKDGQPYGTNSMVLTISETAPAGPRADNFAADSTRWNGVWGCDAHDSYLKLGSGRLQAISDKAGSENTQAFYFWDHRLPTDQSWEVSVDAHLDAGISPPVSEPYFYHALGMDAVIPADLTDLSSSSGLGINFAEDEDGFGNRRRTIQNVLTITNDPGWAELPPHSLPLPSTDVVLKLHYDGLTKTLSSFYRTNSSSAWQLAGSTNFSSLPPSHLQNGFRLHLRSIAEPSFVIQEGQAYFDNFALKYDLSVSNAAVVTKSFDGSRDATITGDLVGVVSGDSVGHDGAGLFNDSEPGLNKPVTANLTLTGTHAAHYTLTQPVGLTGTIQSLSEIFFGSLNPTNVASDGLTYLMKYAYGAADPTNPISQSLRPVTTLTTNGSGQPVLALTYFVRTNDTNLSTQPVWHTNLSDPAPSWSSNVTVTVLGTTNTNGLTLEQRQATIPVDSDSRKFLRLKATLNQ